MKNYIIYFLVLINLNADVYYGSELPYISGNYDFTTTTINVSSGLVNYSDYHIPQSIEYADSKVEHMFYADACVNDGTNNDCVDSTYVSLYYLTSPLNMNNSPSNSISTYVGMRYSTNAFLSDPNFDVFQSNSQLYYSNTTVDVENPVVLNTCDTATTNRFTNDNSSSFCVCKPDYLPTTDPTTCTPYPQENICSQSFTDSTVDDLFSDVFDYAGDTYVNDFGSTVGYSYGGFFFKSVTATECTLDNITTHLTNAGYTLATIGSYGVISQEIRYFPCVNECNMVVKHKYYDDGTGNYIAEILFDNNTPPPPDTNTTPPPYTPPSPINPDATGTNPNDVPTSIDLSTPDYTDIESGVNGADTGGVTTTTGTSTTTNADGSTSTTTSTNQQDNSGALATIRAIASASNRNHADLSRLNQNIDNTGNSVDKSSELNHDDLSAIKDTLDNSNGFLEQIKDALIPSDSLIGQMTSTIDDFSTALDKTDGSSIHSSLVASFGTISSVGSSPTVSSSTGGCSFTVELFGSSILFDMSMFQVIKPYMLSLALLFLAFFNFKMYAWIFKSLVHLM